MRRIGATLLALFGLFAATLAVVDSDPGHRWVAGRIDAIRTANGLRFAIGRIDGSLYGRARISDLRVYDLDGLVFRAPQVTLDWQPWRWFSNRLAITELAVPRATLFHAPHTRKTKPGGPLLPDFDIHIGRLTVDRLTLAKPVLGRERIGRLSGRADIGSGRAVVDLAALVEGTDALTFRIDAQPDADRFDIDVAARGGADGVLARMVGIPAPVRVDVGGDGSWTGWRGVARAQAGGRTLLDLALAAKAGRYTLSGMAAPSPFLKGKLQRMSAPRVLVNGTAGFAERRLDGTLSLRSAALALDTSGTIDLGASAYRNVRIAGRLLRPEMLFPNMTARALTVRAILDGPFGTASYDYRLAAERFAFDRTGFEAARAAGRGHLSKAPVLVPIRFTAARVTGVGNVAGGILRNLAVAGTLRITPSLLTGDALKLSSDKLSGRIGVMLDLRTGRFEIGVQGGLGRYLIPGLGLVAVQSRLSVVPGPGGKGTRIVGRGEARMLRLDNGFFRSLAGGLPRITTALERTPDGILRFHNLILTAPSIRLAGEGYRRRDGSFHFEGSGRQASYGPLRIVLDGDIAKPTVDLLLAGPNATLGLSQVRAHLDPTPQGFAYRAAGGSRLGAFTSEGAILLPGGGSDGTIAIARLDTASARAAGNLAIVDGGFAGRLAVTGGATGELLFRPVGEIQRIEGHIDARAARFGDIALRVGHLDFVTLLDPAGTSLEASATGQGLRRGALRLARFTGNAALKGGVGTIRASIAGTRGRAFDIQTVTQVAPDRYTIAAQGTLDGRPLRLLTPAIVSREGSGWRLASTQLRFGGGEARVGGLFTDAASSIDASLAAMPLAVLDIGYPGLGLGGSASGTLSFAIAQGAAPTGRVAMTVRGLNRSGLVLSSRPVDVGIAGVLTATRLGVRAVAASGGKTVGRAQALLTPLGSGDLVRRMADAPLFAQVRYAGPADTLWRLTGIELFDLSGPVAIGADVRGRLSAPTIAGTIRADNARIESATTGTILTNVQASGRFAGSRLAIDRFAAAAGKGGRVSGSGAFDFAAPAGGVGLALRVQADHAVMIARDDIGATVTGLLDFRSDGRGGTISGDVVLDRSRYRLGQATAATAAPQINVREINVPGGDDGDDDAPPRPWTLAIHARAPAQVMVSGLGLTSEWAADLRIAGSPANPAITGRANLIRGDYEFAGREFDLDRGIIRFAGEVPANPALDIEANADSTGLNASIRVTGNALKPEITFASTPALPQDELLSRLLFGTSITNLSAPEALQLAAAVAALQGGSGGLNPINAVRRAAGLDRLRILPADPQTGQGTSVAAGKYVTRRLYAEIVTDGQGYSATQVEFQVTRWLSILSSISTLGRQSANVRVSRDY
ncbi:MAG TPA: translocation/assembly module TamB domain-containing protein [Sphingomonas sp.]|jgi:translocation and assembly module TamB|nr:translocation/assembly module TamB domain-containing protein [Sphingomonas sp.]